MKIQGRIRKASVALILCACAHSVDEPQRSPSRAGTTTDGDAPYNVPLPNSRAGSAGQSGKGGASALGGSSGHGAGGASGAGGSAGTGAADSSAGRGGELANGGATAAGAAGGSSGASTDCPSLTRVRMPNGDCVDRVKEFSVAKRPTNIVTGSDGQLWVDDETGNQLLRLDRDGRVIDRIDCDAGSSPRALAAGVGDAILWYIDAHAKSLIRLGQDKQKTSYQLDFAPSAIALGERDELYLAEATKAVYRIRPNQPSTRWAGSPLDVLVFGPDKNLWYPNGSLIARLTPDGKKQEFSFTDGTADGLCVGPDSALWFTDNWLNQIGRLDLDGKLTRTFDLPINTGPGRIIAGPDGALWFTEWAGNNVGRITLSGLINHFPVPTELGVAYALTVGPDHNIWFTESETGKVGRLIPDPIP